MQQEKVKSVEYIVVYQYYNQLVVVWSVKCIMKSVQLV